MSVQREIAWAAWQCVPLADPESLSLMGFATPPDYSSRVRSLLDGYGYPPELRARFAEDAAAAAYECAVNISPRMVLPDVVDEASPVGICLRQHAWISARLDDINAAARLARPARAAHPSRPAGLPAT